MMRLTQMLHFLRQSSEENEQSDEALLRRFLEQGEELAFRAILHRHGSMVLGVCQRVLEHPEDVEDAFQATFLILFRQAESIRKLSSLCSWLYGVALRTAKKALTMNHQRRQAEQQVEPRESTPSEEEILWKELRPILDEEVERLPEKYRLPILLCYFEGRTYEDAARDLGWPTGTLSTRLTKGRDLLRSRLSKRGITLTSTMLVTLLTRSGQAVSLSLERATLSQLLASAGQPLTSGPVHLLAHGVIQSMTTSKLTVLTVLVVGSLLTLSGVGLVAYQKSTKKPTTSGTTRQPVSSTKKVPPTARERLLTLIHAEKKTFDKIDDPTIQLEMMLDLLTQKHSTEEQPLQFEINEKAFQAEGIMDVGTEEVCQKPLPDVRDRPLGDYLRIVLGRVSIPSGATFIVRKNYVEITTKDYLHREIWGEKHPGPYLPLVNSRFVKMPLKEAVEQLAQQSSYNILIDARVADKTSIAIIANLTNTPLDTAIALLADMAELGVIRRENVLYITSTENAKQWKEQLEIREKKLSEKWERKQKEQLKTTLK